jgi:chemotaxis protein histidine kinase CheA
VETHQELNERDAARQRARAHLETMKRRSSEAGIPVLERVAHAAEALIAVQPGSVDTEREVMETVFRSLDIMALLVDDAGRRRQGYPPAALHEAVHVLLEQMERVKPAESH